MKRKKNGTEPFVLFLGEGWESEREKRIFLELKSPGSDVLITA